MSENKELINKSAILSTDLSTGGKLNPDQASEFIDKVFDLAGLTGVVTTVKFDNETKELDKLDIDERVVFPKSEGSHTGKWSGITTSQTTLTPFRYMTSIEVSDEFIQRNIKKKQITAKLLEVFAKRIGNNLEQYALNGDVLGASQPESLLTPGGSATDRVKDTLYAKGDGWLRQADSGHVYDANDNEDISLVVANLVNQMPSQYKTNLSELRLIMPVNIQTNYQYQLSQRGTVLGDMMKVGIQSVKAFGIPLLSLPLMSNRAIKVKHVTLTGTTAVSLGYKNILASEVWVTSSTLGNTAETPKIDTTDYVIDEANGTIARPSSGSAITSGTTVKVTFLAPPEIILTHPSNLVIAMNTDDMVIERERIPSAQTWKFYISGSIDVKVIETDAVVKAKNVKDSLVIS